MNTSLDPALPIHLCSDCLTFEQTVPRTLVHRAALSEVYVADSVEVGNREYVLAIQVPRAHCVWFDRHAPYHDLLATGEAARQAVYVVVHRHLGLSAGLTFTLRGLDLRMVDLESYRDPGTAPLQGLLTLRLVEGAAGEGDVGTMAFAGGLAINGRAAMKLRGDLAFFSRDDYIALRAYQRRRNVARQTRPVSGKLPLAAAAVGRRDQRNCLLGAPDKRGEAGTELRYPVFVDQEHPSYFDHGYDHVPGPLIVEAYRQAAVVTAHRCGALFTPVAAVTACHAEFTDYAELDATLECGATVRPAGEASPICVEVRLLQRGRAVSSGLIELAPYPEETPLG